MTVVFLVVAAMLVGFVLLAVEVFALPGFGVIGLLGLAAIGGSGYLATSELAPTVAAAALLGSALLGILLFWLAPKSGVAQSFVLQQQITGSGVPEGLGLLAGREGVSLSPLRPSGIAEIGGATIDVVTDGEYVAPGTSIRVATVEGHRVVVVPINDDHPLPRANAPVTQHLQSANAEKH